MKLLSNFFDINSFVKKEQIVGELPSSNEVYRRSFDIAWPSALEMVLISLISMLDLIMVGGLGTAAVAAVGITDQPKFIIMATILALNVGVTVIVSRRRGEGDREGANRCLRNAVVISAILSFILSLIGFVFAEQILYIAQASSDYIGQATTYFRIVMVGNFFTCVGLTMTSAQRGAGNTKISMKTNLTANIVNVIFNYLLINGIWIFPEWGVAGAAVATALGNFVSFLMAVYSVSQKDQFLHLSLKHEWLPHKETINQLVNISKASFIEQIFIRIGFFAFATQVAGLGTLAYATHTLCMKVMNMTFSVGDGLSVASSSLVGQNLGAKRPDMAIIYSRAMQRVGLLVSIVMAVCIAVFRIPILQFLSQSNMDIVEAGKNIMLVLAVGVAMQVIQVIAMGSLRGAGDLKFVARLMFISVTFIRPVLTYVMAYVLGFGLIGAWFAVIIDQAIRNVTSQIRFDSCKWINIKV